MDLASQPGVWRTGNLACRRTRSVARRCVHAACIGAVPLLGRLGSEGRTATDAVTLPLVLAAAVRVERRRAVRADDPEVLKSVVVGDTIDVVENQRHVVASPLLSLAAELALAPLETVAIEAAFQLAAVVGRVLNEDLAERASRSRVRPATSLCAVWVEVRDRDIPQRHVLLQCPVVAARGSQAQAPQCLGV